MEVHSRSEPRPEYLSFETALAARKLAEDVMLVKAGENVVLSADTGTDMRAVNAVAQAVFAARAHPVIVWYEDIGGSGKEPPAPVAGAIRQADVWIEFAVSYIMHSDAFRAAINAGARYINLTGMDVHMLVSTIGRVDLKAAIEFGATLQQLIQASDQVRIDTPGGTSLTAVNGGRPVLLRGKRAERPGETVMLAGQVSWNPVEESIEGTLVFDGAVWPPPELGLLRERIVCEVHEGRVTKISGSAEADIFVGWLRGFGDENMYRIAHVSPGFNPGVQHPTGRIVEDERVFGGVEIGIGAKGAWLGGTLWSAPAHTDGSMLNPSIYLDGVPIETKGRYVHPDLVRLAAEMGVPGY